jgi:hypothetical protein
LDQSLDGYVDHGVCALVLVLLDRLEEAKLEVAKLPGLDPTWTQAQPAAFHLAFARAV